ncbi:MAG: J domain-containing protein [Oligoflexales bacterium]|nr:J domain-containing protein [Oligoflexales bacterium]
MAKKQHDCDIQNDWFCLAIDSQLGVFDCLEKVIRHHRKKIALVSSLQDNLCHNSRDSTDSISELKRKLKTFENTLTFRLGLLSPERTGAWFRKSLTGDNSALFNNILSEPVFSAFLPEDLPKLKMAIELSWHNREILNLPFTSKTPCLWYTLLSLNREWGQINSLKNLDQPLKLEELPETLPDEYCSPSLISFLINVKSLLLSARSDLDRCYEMLLGASRKFWEFQEALIRKKDIYEAYASSQRKSKNSRAEELRSQFRERRKAKQETTQAIPQNDLEALRFMEFDTYPDKSELRKKYLTLARKLHPDCQGGNEEDFKTLTRHYSHLSNCIQSRIVYKS